jgi:hypothetical protein
MPSGKITFEEVRALLPEDAFILKLDPDANYLILFDRKQVPVFAAEGIVTMPGFGMKAIICLVDDPSTAVRVFELKYEETRPV